MTTVLDTCTLLSVFLTPSKDKEFSAATLLAADDTALFRLLPFILIIIERIASVPPSRQSFVALVQALRARISSCRWLKFRFLHLIQHPAFASFWTYRPIYRTQCYTVARHVAAELVRSTATLRNQHPIHRHASAPMPHDADALLSFAADVLFHPSIGVRRRTLIQDALSYRDAFLGSELIDTILEHHPTIAKRPDAINLAQALVQLGAIHAASAARPRHFADSPVVIYKTRASIRRAEDENDRFAIISTDGVTFSSRELSYDSNSFRPIRRVELRVPVDMIDVQSLHFWSKDIFAKRVESGHKFDFRSVVHPLYASELDLGGGRVSRGLPGAAVSNENAERVRSTVTSTHPTQSVDDATAAWIQDSSVVASVYVRKVFDSLARPMIVELRRPREDGDMEDEDHLISVPPAIMVKSGDDLMQDVGVQLLFRCFNHMWAKTLAGENGGFPPYSLVYEIFPCSVSRGLMEGVSGLTSLKEFDWKAWGAANAGNPKVVNRMVASAVGSYLGTYILGGRDRHYDNVLVKDQQHLFHIDFSYILGNKPPIDGPPLSIAPSMEKAFVKLGVWQSFIDLSIKAFCVLRGQGGHVVRTAMLVFSRAGHEMPIVRDFLRGESSLNLLNSEQQACGWLRHQLEQSTSSVGNWFKEFTHETVVPAWFGLLKNGFPPAMTIMEFMDKRKRKAAESGAAEMLGGQVDESEKMQM